MRRFVLIGLVLLAAGCGARSTDHWLGQLKDSDVVKRRQAIRELGARTGDAPRIAPALVKALGDENAYIRRDSAVALGKLGPEAKQAVPALLDALRDKDRRVGTAALAALKKIDPESAAKAGGR